MELTKMNKTKLNIGQTERFVSVLGGGLLLLMALARRSRIRLPYALTGGYLLYRGISGRDTIYELMGINRAGPEGRGGVEVDHTMTVYRPRQEVYSFWSDFEILPRFMQHLESVEVIEGNRSRWVAKGPLDSRIDWIAETVEDRPNELIAWRSLPGSEIENSGVVRFNEAPGGRGTEVHIQLQYHPPAGSASAAIAGLLGEEPNRQVLDDLRRFKQMIETGETASVFGQTSGRKDQVEQEREQLKKRKRKDIVQKASEDSFPASDPPSWAVGERR
jgi:uncharacterized membrane protein